MPMLLTSFFLTLLFFPIVSSSSYVTSRPARRTTATAYYSAPTPRPNQDIKWWEAATTRIKGNNNNKLEKLLLCLGRNRPILSASARVSPTAVLDPLLSRLLRQHQQQQLQQEDFDNNNDAPPETEDNASSTTTTISIPLLLRMWNNNTTTGGSLWHISQSLAIWRTCLQKGRLPTLRVDFVEDVAFWPPEPLYTALGNVLTQLQLPSFTLRHPEFTDTVLLSVLNVAQQFAHSQQDLFENIINNEAVSDMATVVHSDSSEEDTMIRMAEKISSGLIQELGPAVNGIRLLDELFGYQQLSQVLPLNPSDDDDNIGYGLQDGIWQHTGWQLIPELQREINAMPELRKLLKELGHRPTAEGKQTHQRQFPPRTPNEQLGSMGAIWDPLLARTSVTGLTLSSSLTEMVPSEAILLLNSSNNDTTTASNNSSRWRRLLFGAKRAESKLLSYQISGWSDQASIVRRQKRRQRMPSDTGGDFIVCLDTSWSMMSGTRERLSKAVALACVVAAQRQGRTCRVVAFSNERGVMDAGGGGSEPGVNMKQLLEFLSHSFGGGTDVTGALKYAMATFDLAEASDLLLITDGEIPDPPVNNEMLQDLELCRQRTGMQIHGLLVGTNESVPLERLCDHIHSFLADYELLGIKQLGQASDIATDNSPITTGVSAWMLHPTSGGRTKARSGAGSSVGWSGRPRNDFPLKRKPLALFARKYSEEFKQGRKGGKRNKKFDDDFYEESGYYDSYNKDSSEQSEASPSPLPPMAGSFNALVDDAVDRIRKSVDAEVKQNAWKPLTLDEEKGVEGSCWHYKHQLEEAINRVNENLIEREEESRIVVLGLVSGEHLLLLGKPGTAKSELGRRLSKLCGGPFFQRLLTRFTTPEEIFGPLSLRALENDEYRRCTDGFFPTASVAFLDEIFKANSAILNTLLTILNERQFDNGGGVREACPVRCVLAASNELPDSDELDALYDRFLLRKEVLSLSDNGLLEMLRLSQPGHTVCDNDNTGLTGPAERCDLVFTDGLDRVVEALSLAAESTDIGDGICFLLRDLRNFVSEDLDVDISDRRMVKASKLLKLSAAAHGRNRVDPIDCLLLQHVTWQLPDHKSTIQQWLWDHLTPGTLTTAEGSTSSATMQCFVLLNNLRQEALAAVRKTSGDVSGSQGGREADIAIIDSLRTEVKQIAAILKQQSDDLARHIELLRRSTDHLWLNPDEARAVQQLLIPKGEDRLIDSDRALCCARSLLVALCDELPSSPPNEARVSVIELLWDDDDSLVGSQRFTDDELMNISMKEAKAKYDKETFRRWKRERKKLQT